MIKPPVWSPSVLKLYLMLEGRPSVRAACRWVWDWGGWRDGACDIHSLTDVGKVRVALLISPICCLGVENTRSCMCIQICLLRSHISAVLTFVGRHVDTPAITADWVGPTKGPGHVIEHRVVRPVETAIMLVGVKPQPPVVPMCLRHLNVR